MQPDFTEGTEYPIGIILGNIGLDITIFSGRLLDIGCGRSARLVRYLRNTNIYAEGIDPKTRKESYLMVCDAESIPRPDEYYDFVSAHSTLFLAGTKLYHEQVTEAMGKEAFRSFYISVRENMICAAKEALRVLKRGKRFVIWPRPELFVDDLRMSFGGSMELSIEEVGLNLSQRLKGSDEEDLYYRAILTKL